MTNTVAAHPAADLQSQAGEVYDASHRLVFHALAANPDRGRRRRRAVRRAPFCEEPGERLCARDTSHTGWGTVFGRALAKTNNFFLATAAAQIVISFAQYCDPPAGIIAAVHFLFTIAAVFQGAVWAREIILGAIEHRTSARTIMARRWSTRWG